MTTPDPGPGYRLLQSGEIIDKEDTVYVNRNGVLWTKTAGAGEEFNMTDYNWHRRKTHPDKGGWRRIDQDRTSYPCMVMSWYANRWTVDEAYSYEELIRLDGRRYWQELVAPEPEPSPAEVAWEKWSNETGYQASQGGKQIWLAAWAAKP
jgi:hypothetical protein